MQQQEGRGSSSTGWVTSRSCQPHQPPHADPSPAALPLATGLVLKQRPHYTEPKASMSSSLPLIMLLL